MDGHRLSKKHTDGLMNRLTECQKIQTDGQTGNIQMEVETEEQANRLEIDKCQRDGWTVRET